MAKVIKIDPQDRIDSITLNAKNESFNELRHTFSKDVLRRYHQIKENLENFDEIIANESVIITRLKNIASKDTYTDNDLLNMGVGLCFLYNITDDGE